MRTGLLWYDDSKLDLHAKVLEAADRYSEKFGARPNRCYVHPGCMGKQEPHVDGIRLVPSQAVLPNHFWVGVDTGASTNQGDPPDPDYRPAADEA